ncbi:unnamed protein product [Ilex paraguariensis]|uniref:F-box protein n=1 Tax=Ilex paraguariensis TaxID=185542 RepID=A0ABC8U2Q5_9AQUA
MHGTAISFSNSQNKSVELAKAFAPLAVSKMDLTMILNKKTFGLAAVGSAFAGSSSLGAWATMLGVVGGALASIVNTVEHGGQVGMVFEMYRSNAGFFRLMEESVESNLNESDVGRRENGELFEMKVALQLGRSLSELRDLAASSSRKGQTDEEFANKLF